MMSLSTEDFIIREEQGRAIDPRHIYHAYWDAIGGVWTLGPGLTRGITRNTSMTGIQVLQYFHRELIPFENIVRARVTVPLTKNQRTVLISFAYNVGTGVGTRRGGFVNSSIPALLARKLYSRVPGVLRQYVHGRHQKGVVRGLVNRRNAEIKLWNTPDD